MIVIKMHNLTRAFGRRGRNQNFNDALCLFDAFVDSSMIEIALPHGTAQSVADAINRAIATSEKEGA